MLKKILLNSFFSLIILSGVKNIYAQESVTPVTQIQAILIKPDILCGRFNQTKQLVGIQKPLSSTGRFCVVSNQGVLWQTLQPFANSIRLTKNQITQLQGNQTVLQMNAQQEPVVGIINSILFSLLAGDFSQLDKLFTIEGNVQHQQWSVVLKARDPGLAKVFGSIQLAGDAYVKKVILNEANGDQTIIIFSDIKTGKSALRPAEEALFEQQPTT